jgi:hypothetical protein
MWSALRGRRLNGMKFVRQYSIGAYFVDFVCREHAVIVEIDGQPIAPMKKLHMTQTAQNFFARRAIEYSVSRTSMSTRILTKCVRH